MKAFFTPCFVLLAALVACCAQPERPVVDAIYSYAVPSIDGELDESIWTSQAAYALGGLQGGESLIESAQVQFAWNYEGLFVSVRCEDSSIIQSNREDERKHFKFGDLFEIFVKPKNDSYYWETYVTPYGNKTTLFLFKSTGGHVFTDILDGHDFRDLQVAAKKDVEFDLNGKTVRGWTAEMWIPRSYMTHFDEPWEAGAPWTVLCGRYNYNADLTREPVYGMYPALSVLDFHKTDEYAELRLLPPVESVD
jgi:hypothetical protein